MRQPPRKPPPLLDEIDALDELGEAVVSVRSRDPDPGEHEPYEAELSDEFGKSVDALRLSPQELGDLVRDLLEMEQNYFDAEPGAAAQFDAARNAESQRTFAQLYPLLVRAVLFARSGGLSLKVKGVSIRRAEFWQLRGKSKRLWDLILSMFCRRTALRATISQRDSVAHEDPETGT